VAPDIVCLLPFTHTRTHAWTHAHTHTHTPDEGPGSGAWYYFLQHIDLCLLLLCVQPPGWLQVYICVCIYIHTYVYIHLYIYISVNVYIHWYIYDIYVCMYVCMYIYTPCSHTHKHTHTHTHTHLQGGRRHGPWVAVDARDAGTTSEKSETFSLVTDWTNGVGSHRSSLVTH